MTAELFEVGVPAQRLTEADMVALLDRRYTQVRTGTTADRYVRASHVFNTQATWWHNRTTPDGATVTRRIADYIAIDKYMSHQALHGHEIKVARSDWLAELQQPEKSDDWRRWCNYWWIVAAPGVVKKDELPEGWGLMEPAPSGLRIKRRARRHENTMVPLDVVAGIAYAAQKNEKGTCHGRD